MSLDLQLSHEFIGCGDDDQSILGSGGQVDDELVQVSMLVISVGFQPNDHRLVQAAEATNRVHRHPLSGLAAAVTAQGARPCNGTANMTSRCRSYSSRYVWTNDYNKQVIRHTQPRFSFISMEGRGGRVEPLLKDHLKLQSQEKWSLKGVLFAIEKGWGWHFSYGNQMRQIHTHLHAHTRT